MNLDISELYNRTLTFALIFQKFCLGLIFIYAQKYISIALSFSVTFAPLPWPVVGKCIYKIKVLINRITPNVPKNSKWTHPMIMMVKSIHHNLVNFLHFLLSGNDETEGENLLNGSPKIVVERTIFTQKTFDEAFEPGARPSPTIKQRAQRKMTKYSCSGSCFKDFLFTLFPFIAILKNYKIKQDLPGDVIAGLTVGIMHIPQGKG